MTPAAWVGRRREGQPLSKYSSLRKTEWKQRARPLRKDIPGRHLQAGECGAGKFLGALRRALSALMSEHHLSEYLFSAKIACSDSKGLLRGAALHAQPPPGAGGRLINYGSSLSFCHYIKAGMWHLKCSVGRKMRDLYVQLYGNAHSSFDI